MSYMLVNGLQIKTIRLFISFNFQSYTLISFQIRLRKTLYVFSIDMVLIFGYTQKEKMIKT